jgi:lipoate-protein ligase A
LSSFRLLHERGPASTLFGPRSYAGVPTVVSCHVQQPALVLGSTQPRSVALADAPVDVVHRRSGGGAVLVEPDGVAWVDVFVPAGHPLWEDDVGRAFWWLGDAWAAALGALGGLGGEPVVHRGPLVTTRWSGLVCFAGLGPGEVTVDGRKVVGMAQRRTREGALFQCALALSWFPERLLALLEWRSHVRSDDAGDHSNDVSAALGELSDVVHPIGARKPDDVAMALHDHLP